MEYEIQTKEQLIRELDHLRRTNAELEKSETDRLRAEEALRESEERFKAQYLGNPTPTFTWQKKGEDFELIDFNNAARTITDGRVVDFLGKKANELYGHRQEILRDLQRCFDEREIINRVTSSEHFIPGRLIVVTMGFVPPDLVMVHLEDITDRKRAEEALRESEENYRNLFENANEAIFVAQDGKLVFLNPRTVIMIGYSPEEIWSRPFIDFIHPDDRNMVIDRHVRRMKGEEISQVYDFRIIPKEGNVKWVELNVVRINWKGRTATLNFLNDITERKKTEEALRESEERYRVLIEKSNDGIALVKGDRHIFVNQKMAEIFGYDRPEEIIGQPVPMLIYPDDRELVVNTNRRRQKGESVPDKYEFRGQRKNRESLHIEASATKTIYQGETVSLVYLRDITDRKLAEETLKTLSLKDDLTSLYNRRGFFALADQWLKNAQRTRTEMLIIFGDLDNLKGINDTFGHKEGDQALVDTSRILKDTFRESDLIARLGGDEFVILAMNSFETSAEKLIQRLKNALKDYNRQTKRSYTLSLSLGVAFFDPRNPCSIDALLAQADQLMYENKLKKG